MFDPTNPLIVQGDKSVLLEATNALYGEARDVLARFAELEKSPEYIHTYRITPLSLWNAASAGMPAQEIVDGLTRYAKYPVPAHVLRDIVEYVSRYGRVKLLRQDDQLLLASDDPLLLDELASHRKLQPMILGRADRRHLRVNPALRGHIKQVLVQIGYPAEDLAGYVRGDDLSFSLRAVTAQGGVFTLRAYQQDAADIFYAAGSARGGSGAIVLPCGAGKTVVGMSVMAQMQTSTLILTPNTVAVRQWITELLDKTTLTAEDIGEYSGLTKEIKPVTISTYQILTYRRKASKHGNVDDFEHFALFNARNWGLIIYDEVHLLPAPVFRITAELQARRRLGLTATLVREDGMESDVFSLIGPKKVDVPWKVLEHQGWIATAHCHEVRIRLRDELRTDYAVAPQRQKYAIAAQNPEKITVLRKLLARHDDDHVLIIGMYLEQLEEIAAQLDAPLITGKTPVRQREELYEQFRTGEVTCLVVSKVANFSIDLPDANVAIEVSGTFGSRQEEAQRLGRILRPKRDQATAHFYTLVTRDTVDQTFAANRQRFLTEQGYEYEILYGDEV